MLDQLDHMIFCVKKPRVLPLTNNLIQPIWKEHTHTHTQLAPKNQMMGSSKFVKISQQLPGGPHFQGQGTLVSKNASIWMHLSRWAMMNRQMFGGDLVADQSFAKNWWGGKNKSTKNEWSKHWHVSMIDLSNGQKTGKFILEAFENSVVIQMPSTFW